MSEQAVDVAQNTALTDFNPFSPDFVRNPYPYYHRLRAAEPLHKSPMGFWVASRNKDVALILRDRRFGKGFEQRTIRRVGEDGAEVLFEPRDVVGQHAHDLRERHARRQLVLRQVRLRRRGGQRDAARQVCVGAAGEGLEAQHVRDVEGAGALRGRRRCYGEQRGRGAHRATRSIIARRRRSAAHS